MVLLLLTNKTYIDSPQKLWAPVIVCRGTDRAMSRRAHLRVH